MKSRSLSLARSRSRSRSTVLVCALALASAFTMPAVAHAQHARATANDASERASRLKKQGDEAIMNIKYAEALRLYDESFRLLPNPALHYNRGRAFEALERYPEAIDAYETFLSDASSELRAKTPGLKEHVEELRKKTTNLTLDVDAAGARVLLRQAVLGMTPLSATRVNAGNATLEIEKDGYLPHRAQLELQGGADLTVRVHLVPKAPALQTSTEPTHVVEPATPSETEKPITQKWWFWTGVGVVVVGGATVAVIALTGKSDPEPRAGTLGTVAAPLVRF